MNHNRRLVLKSTTSVTVLGLAFMAGLIKPGNVHSASAAYNDKAFSAKTLDELMKALGGKLPRENSAVTLSAPDIAENGAVVAIGAASAVPNTSEMAILVSNNPAILAAHFVLGPGTDPKLNTRIKIGRSSDVFVLVKADNQYFFAKKEVRVTLGGCAA